MAIEVDSGRQKPGPSGGGGGSGGRPTSASTEVEGSEDSSPEVGDMILVGISYLILILLFPILIFQAVQVCLFSLRLTQGSHSPGNQGG